MLIKVGVSYHNCLYQRQLLVRYEMVAMSVEMDITSP